MTSKDDRSRSKKGLVYDDRNTQVLDKTGPDVFDGEPCHCTAWIELTYTPEQTERINALFAAFLAENPDGDWLMFPSDGTELKIAYPDETGPETKETTDD